MRLADFDFDLPEELIALRPAVPRSSSRLLVARGGAIEDASFADLARFLRPGDLLVFNDTKVIPVRLFGVRHRESRDGPGVAKIEVTLIERAGPDHWRALAKPARRLSVGDRLVFGELGAVVAARDGGMVDLVFEVDGAALDAAIAAAGVMPLPPYIAGRRAADARDLADYQTHFAARSGAVAAPTASLHFDGAVLSDLHARGIGWTRVTLHVGAGTFLPMTADRVEDHRMHAEWGEIPEHAADAINAARARGGRIIAAGTTALRLLESAADADRVAHPFQGETDIFITPGHRFNGVDGLITNFHLPKSTLVVLVAALIGIEPAKALYAHAIAQKYRFYSYGDGSLLIP